MRKQIDAMMEADDKLTSTKLRCQLVEIYPTLEVSLNTLKRARKDN